MKPTDAHVARAMFVWSLVSLGPLVVSLALALAAGTAAMPTPWRGVSVIFSSLDERGLEALALLLVLGLPLARNGAIVVDTWRAGQRRDFWLALFGIVFVLGWMLFTVWSAERSAGA